MMSVYVLICMDIGRYGDSKGTELSQYELGPRHDNIHSSNIP
jgi:hypothetical protein